MRQISNGSLSSVWWGFRNEEVIIAEFIALTSIEIDLEIIVFLDLLPNKQLMKIRINFYGEKFIEFSRLNFIAISKWKTFENKAKISYLIQINLQESENHYLWKIYPTQCIENLLFCNTSHWRELNPLSAVTSHKYMLFQKRGFDLFGNYLFPEGSIFRI